MSDTRKSTMQFYKDQADEWRWRVYSKNGDIISVSSEGYKNRVDAENGAALTLTATIDAALQAITVGKMSGHLIRMKPVVVALGESCSAALAALEEMSIYVNGQITEKGKVLYNEQIREEYRREEEVLETSKALPPMVQIMHIPVDHQDKPMNVTVRFK